MENLALCVSTYINSNNIAHSPTAVGYRAQAILYQARGYEFAAIIPPLENDEYAYTVFRQNQHLPKQTDLSIAKLMPNPATDCAQLSYDLPDHETLHFFLYDISGKLVMSETLTGSGTYQLATNKLPSSIYYYTLLGSTGTMLTNKLVIVK